MHKIKKIGFYTLLKNYIDGKYLPKHGRLTQVDFFGGLWKFMIYIINTTQNDIFDAKMIPCG